MNVGCIVLNYNDYETTEKFLNNIKDFACFSHILVIDNKSTDDSFEKMQKYINHKIDVIQSPKNGGYGYGNNYGINYLNAKYHCEYILIANPDTIFDKDLVYKLLEYFDENTVIVAPVTLQPNGQNQLPIAWKCPKKSTIYLFSSMILNKLIKPTDYSTSFFEGADVVTPECVQGSLFLFRTDIMKQYGMYDENMFLFFEESLLGLKFKKAGFKTKLCMNLNYIHAHSASINKTIKSQFKQRKIALESLKTLEYSMYKFNNLEKILINIYFKLCYVENFLCLKLYMIFKSKH